MVLVAGILPADFKFFRSVDFFRPLAPLAPQLYMTMRGNHNQAYALGRLRPGVTVETARTEMTTIAARLEHDYPNDLAGVGVGVRTLREHLAGPARGQLFLLLGAVVLVLPLTCRTSPTCSC